MDMISVCSGLSLLCIILSAVTTVEGTCPEGFFPHGDSCYFFSSSMEADWIEAGFFCNRFNGGDLVAVESHSENEFLYQILHFMRSDKSFWMGGTDEFVEGHWIWISTMDKMTFTDWGQGYHDGHGSHEDCLQIQAGGRWKDAVCSVRSNFICEVPALGGPDIVG
uniref:C-type lectin domain-containing protein n=1 Tax=Magallana gigas TaxID=29159 RepID=A0A8W8LJ52_MAGGI|nr:galactose-specific lectin nattectin-like [Crassostrea gigas]